MKSSSTNRRKHHGVGGASTVKDFFRGLGGYRTKRHEANFKKILPSAMAKLVADGLFEPDGNGSYKITAKGLERLKELEA